jgi:hypothetical protein
LTEVDETCIGGSVVERSRLSVYFSVYFAYLAWRLRKSVVTLAVRVVTLAVTESIIFCRVFRRQRVLVFHWHRLPLTGCRWDKRWLTVSRTKPTFCVFSVFGVAAMEKCCDACGDRKYYFRSGFSSSTVAVFQGHRLPLTGNRRDIRWLIGRRTKPTFCVFSVCGVTVMKKCCAACGD